MQEWKYVEGTCNVYVSNDGIVSHRWDYGDCDDKTCIKCECRRGSFDYTPRVNNCGYGRIRFKIYGKFSERLIHRLVAMAFIPNPNNKPQVNHKDGDKTNNNVSNLEWVTSKENMQHASQTGLLTSVGKGGRVLSEESIKEIKENYRGEWGQQKRMSEEYGVSPNVIRYVIFRS